MNNYYCKNCNNIIGTWNNGYKYYNISNYCYFTQSKNNKFIDFLDCKKCNKFIGILCENVCKNCFGKYEILEEKKLYNWFLKYKKIISEDLDHCKICNNKYNFRFQLWFFKELTFYK